ncbi:phosphodiester glycosidase family protein [Mucisphaera sp.]|uniref:phosphodiester glycosidase family protein n=1 Tax=Mucisphaera sp. TaxID=2913024 RepID=UPI003D1145D4
MKTLPTILRCALPILALALTGCQTLQNTQPQPPKTQAHAQPAPAPQPPEPQTASIRVEPFDQQTADGPIRGYLAWIDLTDPALDVFVTSPLPDNHPGNPAAEATNIPTNQWAIDHNAILAVNANFYGFLPEGGTNLIGLSLSDGNIVSPPRTTHAGPDPAIAFTPDNTPKVGRIGPDDLPRFEDAVAGVGGSETAADQLGTLLVEDGLNTGLTARVQPTRRHPRTAAGIDANAKTLILAVIDGRREGWSIGVTLPELADIMLEAGAHAAINLDGGGSSSFYFDRAAWTGSKEPPITNLPSDAKGWRPVANHLGIRIRTNQTEGGGP